MKCETPDKCRIVENGPQTTTLLYCPPVYDGYGKNLNPGQNKTNRPMKCLTCGKNLSDTFLTVAIENYATTYTHSDKIPDCLK